MPQAEIAAEEIRAALRALDFLLGRVDVEAVLDVVFQSFCLGK
jgi:tRNA modification GTPase